MTRTFVDVVDTLVDDFDVVDLLTLVTDRSVVVLDFSAAGVMLVSPEGELRLVAFSSESVRLVELFELQAQEGPCLDAYRSAEPILNQELARAHDRWPHFAPFALNAGFHTAHAVPMRLRRRVIGALNLFQAHERKLTELDIMATQALADLATIALLHNRAAQEAKLIDDQLQHALESRVLIEQAKGVLAERTGLTMNATFQYLREYARNHKLLWRGSPKASSTEPCGSLSPISCGRPTSPDRPPRPAATRPATTPSDDAVLSPSIAPAYAIAG